jgi:hypothetical protein
VSRSITYYIRPMARLPEEETKIMTIRLPIRLAKLLQGEAKRRGIKVNRLMWQLVEDFLVNYGIMDDKNRRRTRL